MFETLNSNKTNQQSNSNPFNFKGMPLEHSEACQNCSCFYSADVIRGTENKKPTIMRYLDICCRCPITSFQELSKRIAIFDIVLAVVVAASELLFTAFPNTYVTVYNVYNMKGEYITRQLAHQSWIFMSVVIIAMFLLILEGWLFEVLWKGANDMDRKKLNRWLNIRVIFFIFNVSLTLYRIVDLQFCLYDLIYVPVMMYRILEIIVIKGLIIEILHYPIQLNV